MNPPEGPRYTIYLGKKIFWYSQNHPQIYFCEENVLSWHKFIVTQAWQSKDPSFMPGWVIPAIVLCILETCFLHCICLQRMKLYTQIRYHHYNHINIFIFFWMRNMEDTVANGLAKLILLSIPPTQFLQHAGKCTARGYSVVSLDNSSHSWVESLSRAVSQPAYTSSLYRNYVI